MNVQVNMLGTSKLEVFKAKVRPNFGIQSVESGLCHASDLFDLDEFIEIQ